MVSGESFNCWDTGSGVTLPVDLAIQDIDVTSGNGNVVSRVDVVLGADVDVSHSENRQLRNGVIGVREPVVVALSSDVSGQSGVSHARRGECVQLR